MKIVYSNIPQSYGPSKLNLFNNSKGGQVNNGHNINPKKQKSKVSSTALGKQGGSPSFKGLGTDIAKKLANNEFSRKVILFAGNNEVLTESLYAALLTCILRPISIMALDKSEENKEKNIYASGHSIASGLLGVVFSVLYTQPIKYLVQGGTDKLMTTVPTAGKPYTQSFNDYQYFHKKALLPRSLFTDEEIYELNRFFKIPQYKKVPHFRIPASSIKEYQSELSEGLVKKLLKEIEQANKSSISTFLNKTLDAVSLPVKATLTIAAIPLILGLFGIKKNSDNKKVTQKQNNIIENNNLNISSKNTQNTANVPTKNINNETNLLKKHTGGSINENN